MSVRPILRPHQRIGGQGSEGGKDCNYRQGGPSHQGDSSRQPCRNAHNNRRKQGGNDEGKDRRKIDSVANDTQGGQHLNHPARRNPQQIKPSTLTRFTMIEQQRIDEHRDERRVDDRQGE